MQKPNTSVIDWKHGVPKTKLKKTFLDDVIKVGNRLSTASKSVLNIIDWKQESANLFMHGHRHKNEVSKLKKETINEEIFRLEKKNRSPAPGAYNNMPKYKPQGIPKQTSDQRMFYNDILFKSLNAPPLNKYNVVEPFKKTHPKIFELKITAPKNKPEKGESSIKVVKSKNPTVGSYDDHASYLKTQLNLKDFHQKLTTKSDKVTFVDQTIKQAKRTKLCPGYYNLDKAYNRMSGSPPQLKMKRH